MKGTGLWIEVDESQPMTEQESTLVRMRRLYGQTAYTVHDRNYKMVGFVRHDGKKAFGVGDTWAEAVDRLARKAAA
jgi:hypothetical protein